jgi:ABC-type transporter Mla subunit MlaD
MLRDLFGGGPAAARGPRKHRYEELHGGMPPFRAGVLALVIIAIACWFAFSKSNPFESHYEIRAVFQNSNLLQVRSPVRIAGIDIGQVVSVGRYKHTNLAVATMDINDSGRPIHADATVKIRPRIFLEGNFFVDLHPGTPTAPEMENGGVIPVTRTEHPVQIDQVLTSLDLSTRQSLQQLLKGFGTALEGKPTAADDANGDPSTRGLTGAQGLNRALANSPQALRDSSIVADALQGEHPNDLSQTVAGFARASRGLTEDESALRALFPEFNQTVAALAAQAPALARSIALLGPTAAHANAGFGALLRGLPATRTFARQLTPAAKETPATIAAAYPWLAQTRPLFGQPELAGLLHELRPATNDLARLGAANRQFLPAIDAFNRCMTDVFLPTGNVKVDDGALSAGVENYKEFWYAMVGQAGEGQFFDGNGSFLRLATTGGSQTIETGRSNYTGNPYFANLPLAPQRTRPAYGNRLPPLRRDVPCFTQHVPDVNGAASFGPADGSKAGAPPPPVPDDPSGLVAQSSRFGGAK